MDATRKIEDDSVPVVDQVYQSVLEAIPCGISVHSPDSTIRQANSHAAANLGKTREEIIGLACDEVFHSESATCPHQEVLTMGQARQFEQRLGVDGPWFKITLEPLFAADGRVAGYVRLAHDVTERVRAQEALLRAERYATLGQMVFGIAHDVGTPLSIISGYSEYLLMRTTPGAAGHKELSTILNQTRRIAEFIRQLLDLARPAQTRSDAISLKSFFNEALELMGHHLRKSGVSAVLTCNQTPAIIYGDAPRLRQAFFNLILNASQRLSGGGKLEIDVGGAPPRTGFVGVVITGSDAAGRRHNYAKLLCEVSEPENRDGALGLGLTVTNEILKESGALIQGLEIESELSLVVYVPLNGKP